MIASLKFVFYSRLISLYGSSLFVLWTGMEVQACPLTSKYLPSKPVELGLNHVHPVDLQLGDSPNIMAPYLHFPLSVLHFTSPSPVPGTTIMRCWTKWLKTTPSGPERKTIVPTFCKAVVLGLVQVQEKAKMEDYQIPYWTVLRTFWKTSRTSLRGFPSPVCWLGHLDRASKERGLRTHPITLHFWDRAPSS